MSAPYPPIEPYETGMLDVGDGQRVYWEACGNPDGKPAVVLHGGPGSGCAEGMRRYFDPNCYRVILFDQRQCGRSTPHASKPGIDLSLNTTEHLLGDIERLREHLGIEHWLVYGGSWGVTLGLAYALRHPERVSEMVWVGVTLPRRSEFRWLYYHAGVLRPAQYERFLAGIPEHDRQDRIIESYHERLMDPDPAICRQAAEDWCDWEESLVSVDPKAKPQARRLEPRWRLAFARIVTHYFSHNAWLDADEMLANAARIANIPGVMIHGAHDVGSRIENAHEVATHWPSGELIVVGGAGHSANDPGMPEAIVGALDRFATRPRRARP